MFGRSELGIVFPRRQPLSQLCLGPGKYLRDFLCGPGKYLRDFLFQFQFPCRRCMAVR